MESVPTPKVLITLNESSDSEGFEVISRSADQVVKEGDAEFVLTSNDIMAEPVDESMDVDVPAKVPSLSAAKDSEADQRKRNAELRALFNTDTVHPCALEESPFVDFFPLPERLAEFGVCPMPNYQGCPLDLLLARGKRISVDELFRHEGPFAKCDIIEIKVTKATAFSEEVAEQEFKYEELYNDAMIKVFNLEAKVDEVTRLRLLDSDVYSNLNDQYHRVYEEIKIENTTMSATIANLEKQLASNKKVHELLDSMSLGDLVNKVIATDDVIAGHISEKVVLEATMVNYRKDHESTEMDHKQQIEAANFSIDEKDKQIAALSEKNAQLVEENKRIKEKMEAIKTTFGQYFD